MCFLDFLPPVPFALPPVADLPVAWVRSAWEWEKASEDGERALRFWLVSSEEGPWPPPAAEEAAPSAPPGGGVSMLARSDALRWPRLIRSGFSFGCGSGRTVRQLVL